MRPSTKPSPASPGPASATEPGAWALTARVFWALAVGLTIAATFFICLVPIAVTDFWWQAKTGELIVRNGSIPSRDPFSWTAQGAPWQVHEWLTEVFFYFAYRPGLEWLLVAYKGGLAALACCLVLARAWTRSGSLFLSISVTVAAAFVLRNYADLRPQMVSFVLIAGLLLALDEYREGRLPRLPWALPLFFALWANLHGGMVVGLALTALWVAGEALGLWLFREGSPDLRSLAVALAASCLAAMLNPHGFAVYTYPFHVLGHPEVMDYIREWQSPVFHGTAMLAFELLLVVTLAVRGFTRERRFGEAAVLAAMAHAALLAQRNTVPFALAAAPALAGSVGLLCRDAALPDALRLCVRPPLRALAAGAAAAALSVLVYSQAPRVPPARWFEHISNLHSFPEQAAALMKEGSWPGNLYNDYVWGGYLIWTLYPQRRVFVDGRAEVYYPSRAFDDEMKIHQLRPGWEEALDRRNVEVILTSRDGVLARALHGHPRWSLAFTGPVEVVYTRKKR